MTWAPERFNEPYRNPWIVTKGDLVFGIGEAIIAYPTREEAQEKADKLNEAETK